MGLHPGNLSFWIQEMNAFLDKYLFPQLSWQNERHAI